MRHPATQAAWCAPLALAALFVGAHAHAQEGCRDLLGAEQMAARCLELKQAGQCDRALAACQEAQARCEALPRFARQLAAVQSDCDTPDTEAPDALAQGQRCDATRACATGLLCASRRCVAHPQAGQKVKALRESARALASLSPCDARELLELACGVAHQASLSDAAQSMRQDLHAARAACRAYNGVACGDPDLPRSRDGAELVSVPAGVFFRGSDKAGLERGLETCRETYTAPAECELSWFRREGPRKEVFVSAFYIDKHEVTNTLYDRCVKAGACQPTRYDTCSLFQKSSGQWKVGGQPHPDVLKPNHPAVCVTWADASAYCAWAGKRLPTEAEWEKAARGSKDAREFPWGDRWSGLNLNWGERSGFGTVDRYVTTSPVGHYPQNVSPYGAMDMSGNAWEWTSDYHSDTYYAASPLRDPVNTQVSTHRVLRGGSWSFAGNGARVAYRYFAEPNNRDDAVGFRCVLDAP